MCLTSCSGAFTCAQPSQSLPPSHLVREEAVEQHCVSRLWLGGNVALGTLREASVCACTNGRIVPLRLLWEGRLAALLDVGQVHVEGGQTVVGARLVIVISGVVVRAVLLTLCVAQHLQAVQSNKRVARL